MLTHEEKRREDDWRRALHSLGVTLFEKRQAEEKATTAAIEAIVEESKRGHEEEAADAELGRTG